MSNRKIFNLTISIFSVFVFTSGFQSVRADVHQWNTKQILQTKTHVASSSNHPRFSQSRVSISDDGLRFVIERVVLGSSTSGFTDTEVVVVNTLTNLETVVSKSVTGERLNGYNGNAEISGNGRYVVFESSATNTGLVNNSGGIQSFRVNIHTGEIKLIGRAPVTESSANGAEDPFVNYDGSVVVFQSRETFHVENDTNQRSDLFLHNFNTSDISRISVDPLENQFVNYSLETSSGSISDDGVFVVFTVFGDGIEQLGFASGSIFLYSTEEKRTTLITASIDGNMPNGASFRPRISGNGLKILYQSNASNIVSENQWHKLIIYDVNTKTSASVNINNQTFEFEDPNRFIIVRDRLSFYDISDDGDTVIYGTQDYINELDVNTGRNSRIRNPGQEEWISAIPSNALSGAGDTFVFWTRRWDVSSSSPQQLARLYFSTSMTSLENIESPLPDPVIEPAEIQVPDESIPGKSAIVITHGWRSTTTFKDSGSYFDYLFGGLEDTQDQFGWPERMAGAICHRLNFNNYWPSANVNTLSVKCNSPTLDVWVFDWSIDAKTNTPIIAQWNAKGQGANLASALTSGQLNYDHIHLIAHSAGSQLINDASYYLKNKDPVNKHNKVIPSIHLTFLDGYDHLAYREAVSLTHANPGRLKLSKYGRDVDYIDNLYDTRYLTELPGPIDILANTKNLLWSGLNVDVTAEDTGESGSGSAGVTTNLTREHNWPIEYYIETIRGTRPGGFNWSASVNGSTDAKLKNLAVNFVNEHISYMRNCVVSSVSPGEDNNANCDYLDGKKWTDTRVRDILPVNYSFFQSKQSSNALIFTSENESQNSRGLQIQFNNIDAISNITTGRSATDGGQNAVRNSTWVVYDIQLSAGSSHLEFDLSVSDDFNDVTTVFFDGVLEQKINHRYLGSASRKYLFPLPPAAISAGTLQLGIKLSSSSDLTAFTSLSNLKIISINERSARTVLRNEWNLVSFPDLGESFTIMDFLPDEIMEEAFGVEWVVYGFDALSHSYQLMDINLPVKEGAGYWFFQNATDSIELQLPGIRDDNLLASGKLVKQCTQLGCYKTPIMNLPERGSWNLLGTTSSRTFNVDSLVFEDTGECQSGCLFGEPSLRYAIAPSLFGYDSSTGSFVGITDSTVSFDAWDGFWIGAYGTDAGSVNLWQP